MTETATGPASLTRRPPSLARLFFDRAARSAQREAYRYPEGDGWRSLTWEETAGRVTAISAGLISLGVRPEDRVAIAAGTSMEWVLADLGILCAGGATTTVYPATIPEEVRFILADSGSVVAFAEDDEQLAKIAKHWHELPDLRTIVVLSGLAAEAARDAGGGDERILTLAGLEERGRALLAEQPDAVERAVAQVGPESLATLVYTSGTTGRPKGVRLVHDNWTYEGAAVDSLQILTEDDLQYLWLPLAHVFGKVLQSVQLTVGFATVVDGNVDRLVDNLAVIRPTFMGAAPRIFEKVHSRVVAMAEAEGGLKLKIFRWACDVGLRVSRLRQQGKEPSGLLAAQYRVADKLVFGKLRARFGGRLRFFVSGSAALSREVAEFLHAAGILVLEGYGLTESSAFSCVNLPERFRFGTVGLPAPGTEARTDVDGELLLRGPGIMRGYHNAPDLTAEALTPDGWLRTGDIAEIEDGFVRITDRKKDLFKTSTGKYVAPQSIEVTFKAICPYVSQMIVHGEGRKFVSALVSLDEDAIVRWAEHQGLTGRAYHEIVASSEARLMVQGYVDSLNTGLARYETIKRFVILPEDLTVEDGDLTPSMKVRRKAVEEKHRQLLDALYAEPATP